MNKKLLDKVINASLDANGLPSGLDSITVDLKTYNEIFAELNDGKYRGFKIVTPLGEEVEKIYKDEDRPRRSLRAAKLTTENKLEEILSKLQNGKERFYTDPVVNNCVRALAMGEDPIKILDQVFTILNQTKDALKEAVINGGTKVVVQIPREGARV